MVYSSVVISLLLILATSTSVAAQVFKCAGDGGKPVFQDKPCGDGKSAKVDVRPAVTSNSHYRTLESAPAKPQVLHNGKWKTVDEIEAENAPSRGSHYAAPSVIWNSAYYMASATDDMRASRMNASTALRRAEAAEAETCLESHRSRYLDPRSAYVVRAFVMRDTVEEYLSVDVSARNRAGGAGREILFCSMAGSAK